MAKKTKKSTEHEELLEELNSLAESLSEEDLLFLINQANVMVYNARAARLNQKRQKVQEKKSTKKGSAAPMSAPASRSFDLEPHSGGKSFILTLNGTRKVLTGAEMNEIARLVDVNASAMKGSVALYRWMEKNRTDIIKDAELNKDASVLELFYEHVNSKIQKRKG